MKGSVRKRKNNAWSYRIDLGYVDGKRRQVEKGGFKSEREATKAMQDVLYHLNNTGDYVENKKISFHTVYEEFIEREGKATRAYATMMLSIGTISRTSSGRCMPTKFRTPCPSTSQTGNASSTARSM